MNNSEIAEAVRHIMSRKLTNFEKDTMEMYFKMNVGNIEHFMANMEINEKNYKAISAVFYLLNAVL